MEGRILSDFYLLLHKIFYISYVFYNDRYYFYTDKYTDFGLKRYNERPEGAFKNMRK